MRVQLRCSAELRELMDKFYELKFKDRDDKAYNQLGMIVESAYNSIEGNIDKIDWNDFNIDEIYKISLNTTMNIDSSTLSSIEILRTKFVSIFNLKGSGLVKNNKCNLNFALTLIFKAAISYC